MTDDAPPRIGRQPIFNVPTGIVALLGVLLAVHLVRGLLPEDADRWFVAATAFIPARYTDAEASTWPGHPIAPGSMWLTHMLVHGSFVHLLFNSAWLLAFGGAVANRIGARRCLLFATLCGATGAFTFLLVHWGSFSPMVGASGAVLGLMGASLRFLLPALDAGRGSLRDIHAVLRSVPLMPLAATLMDVRVLATTGMLIVMNFAGAFGVTPGTDNPIAWEAHAGGYLAGLLLFGLFDTAPHNNAPETGRGREPWSDPPDHSPTLH